MKKLIMMSSLSVGILFSGVFGSINTEAATSQARVKAANTGLKYIGTPYKWGGITPSGFDCSGFVNYNYKKAGISVPRTSASQHQTGKYVGINGLRKGDLVFFNTSGKGVSHVGIHIGNNKFVHASSTGVRVDSMSNSYWKPKFVGGKRI
ncbi:MAG: C40 family peptidase [Bacillus sp. (in: firmicutes)]